MQLKIVSLCTLFVVSASATEELSTSFWDLIPGIAQGKSLIQLIFGDKEGAVATQEHFLNEGLVSSQLRSGYFLVTGEPKKALDIQKKFVSNLEGVLDGMPVVGHVKGGIHLLFGEHDHGWQAIKAATTTSGAIAGAVIGGPVGAIGGHLLTDALISATDVVLNGNQSQPHGMVNYVLNIDKLKPGEHFDVLAGLIFDARAGKVTAKRGSFNNGRFGNERSAESYELQSLLEKKQTDNRKIVGMPKRSRTVAEEVEPKQIEQGASKKMSLSLQAIEYGKLNFLKFLEFYYFLKQNPTYKDFNFYKLWTGETKADSVINIDFDGLDSFQYNYYLDNLDMDSLKNKLSYLTDDQKSLINKHDFRTINTEVSNTNCLLSSLAGIMKLNLETVRRYVNGNLESKNPHIEFNPKLCLESLKKRKLIKYTTSRELSSTLELDTYLKSNVRELENKHILLEENSEINESNKPSYPGHAVVLKFKMVDDNPEPVKLIFDYQYQGFLQPDTPNPFRFQTFIETRIYKYLYVHGIEVLKQ